MTQLVNLFKEVKPIEIVSRFGPNYDSIDSTRKNLGEMEYLSKVKVLDRNSSSCLIKCYFKHGGSIVFSANYNDGILPKSCSGVEFDNPFVSKEFNIDDRIEFLKFISYDDIALEFVNYKPSDYDSITVLSGGSKKCIVEAKIKGEKKGSSAFYIAKLK